MAWSIGANDVANAMGTSVGSGALTLRRAVIIAAILEFSGAFFFGAPVAETLQSGIVNAEIFSSTPLYFVYGMLSALIATGVWLQVASYFGWPVSTTHAIVGGVIGFGCVIGGVDAVYWGNVSFIGVSWVLSPILGGAVSYLLFMFLKQQIFYASRPVEKAKQWTPFCTFAVLITLTMIVIYKGLQNVGYHPAFFEALGISSLVGLLGAFIGFLLVRKAKETGVVSTDYAQVEKIFGFLQIMSACLMAFAHGTNDVANAIGPLSAALEVLRTGAIQPYTQVPAWALALGGFGIVIGLATWGWRVIETIGKKITELTPTRGFAAEFGAAATVLLASQLGLPVSTTHTLVGSVIGVGMARGLEALNLSMTKDIVISWIVTLPVSAIITVSFFYLFKIIFG